LFYNLFILILFLLFSLNLEKSKKAKARQLSSSIVSNRQLQESLRQASTSLKSVDKQPSDVAKQPSSSKIVVDDAAELEFIKRMEKRKLRFAPSPSSIGM
jgi:phosphate starvation-inducible protein PhoH